jgi:DNA-binding NarL/FixJ family response regulator
MTYKILIADDHDIIREGIKTILAKHAEYEITGEAEDGVKVLEQIEALKPDILLLDITMPQKSGLEILDQVRRLSPETKIIIISVHKADAYIMRALKAGVRGYMNKENAADDLLPALRKVISGQFFLSGEASSYILDKVNKTPQELEKEGDLSEREMEVLRLTVEGKTAKEIADAIFISPRTVENYKNNIMRKLGLHKTSDMIKYAIKNKIVDLDTL